MGTFGIITPEEETDYKNVLINILASLETRVKDKLLVMFLHLLVMVGSVIAQWNKDDTISYQICVLLCYIKTTFGEQKVNGAEMRALIEIG